MRCLKYSLDKYNFLKLFAFKKIDLIFLMRTQYRAQRIFFCIIISHKTQVVTFIHGPVDDVLKSIGVFNILYFIQRYSSFVPTK